MEEELVCKITSSLLWKGRELTVGKAEENGKLGGIKLWVPERSSISLPRQGSWQCYYSCCLSCAALFLCRNNFDLDSVRKHWGLLCFVLNLHRSQTLILSPSCWMICLLTLQEVYGEQQKSQQHKVTARSEVRAMVLWCVLSRKSTSLHSNCAAESPSFSHDDYSEWIKLAGICNSLHLVIKWNREQGVSESLSKQHSDTFPPDTWNMI